MNYPKLLAIFLFFGMTFLSYSQKSKTKQEKKSDTKSIKTNIKGIPFIVSDANISTELNEIGVGYFRNKYIFLSNKKRRIIEATKDAPIKEPNNYMYVLNIAENGDLSFPLLFSHKLVSENNQGAVGFSPDFKVIYYTKENAKDSQTYTLHKANFDEKNPDRWINLKDLKIVPAEYSVETPFVSPDGKKIYISSNIPGGHGGFDLYEAPILEDGTIGKLVNLGPQINTASDEKYPFVAADNQYMYFSSKGHDSYGGYDVFRSSIKNEIFSSVINVGPSLNSKNDEIAFAMDSDNKGYITSNNKIKDNYDLLKFEIKKQKNNQQTYSVVKEDSKTALANVVVVIKNEFGKMVAVLKTDNKGTIKFNLKPLEKYTVAINTSGYEEYFAEISLDDEKKHFHLKKK